MIHGVYGAGGTGQELMRQMTNGTMISCRESFVFIDDVLDVEEINGYPVFSYEKIKKQFSPDEIKMIIAIGEPGARKMIYEKIKKDGYSLFTYIDKNAVVDSTAHIGEGCAIDEATYIDHHTVIDDNTFIYRGTMIGHGTHIGAHSIFLIRCFVGGGCELEECIYMGTGALISDHVRVGKNSIISLGAVVFKDVPEKSTAIGNPARILKRGEDNVFREK